MAGASAGEDACTSRDADLNGCSADAAVRAVDEQHLAQSDPRLRENRVVRRDERLRDGGGLLVAETIWDRCDMAFMNQHAVGQTATTNEPEDAVALGEVTHRCAPRENGASDFEAGEPMWWFAHPVNDSEAREHARGVGPRELWDVELFELEQGTQ